MELSSCPADELIDDDSVSVGAPIGHGGFGNVFLAYHHKWCCNVAIKVLHRKDGPTLPHEVSMMRKARNPHVIQQFGVYRGCSLDPCGAVLHGLVMEYMERGSLASLLKTLRGPAPWPLSFRLVHQVALGMNFLHNQNPPVLHLDLKPDNVLLDSSLNAKLTDFGLAKLGGEWEGDSKMEGGTLSFMPPEAFAKQYIPETSSDVYSYGVVVWSIISGKLEPYEQAQPSEVQLHIPRGERPSLDMIQGDAVGLRNLVDLMQRCWSQEAAQRPNSIECARETEKLRKRHEAAINQTVYKVQELLDKKNEKREGERFTADPAAVNLNMLHARPSTDSRCAVASSPQPQEVQVDDGAKAGAKVTGSSKPQRRNSPSHLPRHEGRPAEQLPINHKPSQMKTQRLFSQPESCHIVLSNVCGVQVGNNNYMAIQESSDRRRHQTAPSSTNNSGNSRSQGGQIG